MPIKAIQESAGDYLQQDMIVSGVICASCLFYVSISHITSFLHPQLTRNCTIDSLRPSASVRDLTRGDLALAGELGSLQAVQVQPLARPQRVAH